MSGIDIDRLLSSKNVNGSIIELDNYLGELCNYGENYSDLTRPQLNFFLNQQLEREVNNGGFSQFFFNSTGEFALETIESLESVGAAHTAGLVRDAIAKFPDSMVPKDTDERREMMNRLTESVETQWSELDDAFFAYKDDLNSLNIAYVRAHKDAFQPKSFWRSIRKFLP